MHKVTHVAALPDYHLDVRFDDDTTGIVDLSHLVGKGVFKAWHRPEAFQEVRIGESGELVWDDGIDLCPDSLYLQVTGQRAEDVFPSLKRDPARA